MAAVMASPGPRLRIRDRRRDPDQHNQQCDSDCSRVNPPLQHGSAVGDSCVRGHPDFEAADVVDGFPRRKAEQHAPLVDRIATFPERFDVGLARAARSQPGDDFIAGCR